MDGMAHRFYACSVLLCVVRDGWGYVTYCSGRCGWFDAEQDIGSAGQKQLKKGQCGWLYEEIQGVHERRFELEVGMQTR